MNPLQCNPVLLPEENEIPVHQLCHADFILILQTERHHIGGRDDDLATLHRLNRKVASCRLLLQSTVQPFTMKRVDSLQRSQHDVAQSEMRHHVKIHCREVGRSCHFQDGQAHLDEMLQGMKRQTSTVVVVESVENTKQCDDAPHFGIIHRIDEQVRKNGCAEANLLFSPYGLRLTTKQSSYPSPNVAGPLRHRFKPLLRLLLHRGIEGNEVHRWSRHLHLHLPIVENVVDQNPLLRIRTLTKSSGDRSAQVFYCFLEQVSHQLIKQVVKHVHHVDTNCTLLWQVRVLR